MCGPKGGRLSASQRRRLALSRAIVRKPTVLMVKYSTEEAVDHAAEPESSDLEFAKGVIQALDARTGILATNEMGLVSQCDRICVLERGRVAAEGTWDDLKESLQLHQSRTR